MGDGQTTFTFTDEPDIDPRTPEGAFREFHRENPDVFRQLERMALALKARGFQRCSIELLWNQMRWLTFVKTKGDPDYQLNNNHKSRYARMLVDLHPEMEGWFQFRQSGADDYTTCRGCRRRYRKPKQGESAMHWCPRSVNREETYR